METGRDSNRSCLKYLFILHSQILLHQKLGLYSLESSWLEGLLLQAVHVRHQTNTRVRELYKVSDNSDTETNGQKLSVNTFRLSRAAKDLTSFRMWLKKRFVVVVFFLMLQMPTVKKEMGVIALCSCTFVETLYDVVLLHPKGLLAIW